MVYQAVFMEDLQPLAAAPSKPQAKQRSCARAIKPYIPTTRWTGVLVLATMVQCLTCITIEGFIYSMYLRYCKTARLGYYEAIWTKSLMLAQLIAVILESIYQFLLSVDTAKRRNIVQVFAICTNNFFVLAFTILAWETLAFDFDIANRLYPLIRISFLVLMLVLGLVMILLGVVAWRLYKEFSWAIYRYIAAADRKLRRRYLIYEIYIALLHLNFFFLFGFWVQAVIPLSSDDAIRSVAILGLALTIPALILAAVSVRQEWRTGQAITMILYLVNLAAVSYQVRHLFHLKRPEYIHYDDIGYRMLCYAGIAIILLTASVIMAGACMRNFDKGLLLHNGKSKHGAGDGVQDDIANQTALGHQTVSMGGSHRMIID